MRLFYSTDKSDTSFSITGDDYKHIVKVMRSKRSDHLEVIDGSGWIYTCEIEDIDRHQIKALILNKRLKEAPSYKLGIAISPLKNMSRFEWFLEKSVEIGITDIFPLICKRTEKKNIKEERAKRIIQSAMKQSGNVYEPTLHSNIDIATLSQMTGWGTKYLAYINNESNSLLATRKFLNPHILIGIGPEGGFVAEEVEICLKEKFTPVSLGNSRLRTETAGIVACQIIKTLHEISHANTIPTT